MNLFLEDEIAAAYLSNKKDMDAFCRGFRTIYIVNDGSTFGWMLAAALKHPKIKHQLFVVQKEPVNEVAQEIMDKYELQVLPALDEETMPPYENPSAFFFCCDLSKEAAAKRAQWSESLKYTLALSTRHAKSRFIFIPLLPELQKLPDPVQAMAEVEFSLWIRNFPADTPEGVLSHLEQIIGDQMRERDTNWSIREIRIASPAPVYPNQLPCPYQKCFVLPKRQEKFIFMKTRVYIATRMYAVPSKVLCVWPVLVGMDMHITVLLSAAVFMILLMPFRMKCWKTV